MLRPARHSLHQYYSTLCMHFHSGCSTAQDSDVCRGGAWQSCCFYCCSRAHGVLLAQSFYIALQALFRLRDAYAAWRGYWDLCTHAHVCIPRLLLHIPACTPVVLRLLSPVGWWLEVLGEVTLPLVIGMSLFGNEPGMISPAQTSEVGSALHTI